MKNRPTSILFSPFFIFIVVTALSIPSACPPASAAKFTDDDFRKQRLSMVKEQILERGVKDRSVLEAIMAVPRHKFVSENYLNRAYDDSHVPIGYGQTISQPYIVAYMTEILNLTKNSRVLEVGTG